MFNAWMYLDTTNYTLYMYRNFQWTKLPLVNNGLTLDGSYVQLGGSLVETQPFRQGLMTCFWVEQVVQITFDKYLRQRGLCRAFNSYNSGALEAEITAGGGTASLLVENITDGGNSSIYVIKDGFQASYLHPVIGASFFKMDSTKFRIRGLVSYASRTVPRMQLTRNTSFTKSTTAGLFMSKMELQPRRIFWNRYHQPRPTVDGDQYARTSISKTTTPLFLS